MDLTLIIRFIVGLFVKPIPKPTPVQPAPNVIPFPTIKPEAKKMQPTKTGPLGLEMIKSFEGLKLTPYLCSAGVPTIGYGATFYETNVRVTMKDPAITVQRAEQLLANTLKGFEQRVLSLLTITINQNQFDAIVSFAYNLGTGNLQKSTLLKLINEGNFGAASKEFIKWNKAGGKVLAGLTRRRKAEEELFNKTEA